MQTPIPARLTLFHKKYGNAWKIFLATEAGQAGLHELASMAPKPICDAVEHQPVYRLGSIAGHQQAQVDLVLLSDVRPEPQPAPKINYGVKDSKDDLSEK